MKYDTCKATKRKIDSILKEMSILFVNLGTDSTHEEVEQAYVRENLLIDRIQEIDPEKAQRIRPYVD
jgi:hypothetical protein